MSKYNITLLLSQHRLSNRFSPLFFIHVEFYRMLLETQIYKLTLAAYFFPIKTRLVACFQFVPGLLDSVCLLVVNAIEL